MDTEIHGIVLATVLPLYPMLFYIYQKSRKFDEVVEEFKNTGTSTNDARKE